MHRQQIHIGIIGDFNAVNYTHVNTTKAVSHAARHIGFEIDVEWVPTTELEDPASAIAQLEKYSGLWCSPGSPYQSMAGALNGIRFARETGTPFIGTCGGFQHAIIEYARNVLGYIDAEHEESSPYASRLFVSRLVCSVFDKTLSVNLKPGTRVRHVAGKEHLNEHYYCNFGVNPEYKDLLDEGGLKVSGVDQDGEVRAIELRNHPFFIGTLFLPQNSSTESDPHPLVVGFVQAASTFRAASLASRSENSQDAA